MENLTWLLCFVLILWNDFITQANGKLNIFVKRFELCNPNYDYPSTIYGTIHTVNNIQYVDANATFRIPLDDDLRSKFTVELLIGSNYLEIIKFEEKHTCTSMHRYFGEFVYEVERTAQLVPGLCPIPPGRYHVHNFTLNFNKVTLQAFPLGHMRFKEIATDKNNKLVICLIAEAENMP